MSASLVLVSESSKSDELQPLLALACHTGRVHVAIPARTMLYECFELPSASQQALQSGPMCTSIASEPPVSPPLPTRDSCCCLCNPGTNGCPVDQQLLDWLCEVCAAAGAINPRMSVIPTLSCAGWD